MDDSDLEINETELSQLIAPLGFHIDVCIDQNFCTSSKKYVWAIKNDKGGIAICVPEKDEELRYAKAYDIKTLWELICQIKMFICGIYGSNWKTINNPYCGCKSLEEAMIRKDLFENSCS